MNRPAVVLTGAALGAIILGGGGRLAMRAIAISQGRRPIATLTGVLAVAAWGAGFGTVAALFRLALARWLPSRWQPRAPAIFAFACLSVAMVILTPLTPLRLGLFPPVVLLFAIAFERAAR